VFYTIFYCNNGRPSFCTFIGQIVPAFAIRITNLLTEIQTSSSDVKSFDRLPVAERSPLNLIDVVFYPQKECIMTANRTLPENKSGLSREGIEAQVQERFFTICSITGYNRVSADTTSDRDAAISHTSGTCSVFQDFDLPTFLKLMR
jgi:hypothetical protein